MTDIDSLSLQVKSDAAAASRGLDSLAATLEKLKNATKGGLGLTSTAKGISELAHTLKIIDGGTPETLKRIGESLQTLKNASGVKISANLPKTIEAIANAVRGLGIEETVNLKMLGPAIASLSVANGVKISPTIGPSLKSIVSAVKDVEPSTLNNIRNLADAGSTLSGLNNIKISSTIGKQLMEIGAAVETLNATPLNFSVIEDIASAVAPLATVGKANLTSAISQLKKIPDVARDLEKVDVGKFKQTVSEIASALAPLADEMARISTGFSAFPIKLQKLVAATDSVSTSNKRASMSYTDFYSAMRMAMGAAKRLASWISKAIQNSNDYIESINLFNASMGTFADQATKYADKVADVMGIDPAVWMENQGVFMTLATGFGVAGERAYIMSQQLTQLGYDLSSFFNLPVEEAMQKLQSGLSGELEPLRRLGFDLSQARLEAIAFSLGIDKAYSSMSQAEKSQLRYYAIMTQVTTAQGDMARTLESPANQLRILSAQATQAARAFGNALIPVLNKILPFAIAAAKAIRILAASVASLFGYELPEVDYSGITGTTGAVEDLTDSLNGAGGSAKKLKSYLMGFDELNVIDQNSGSGGGGGGGLGGITGGDFDFDLPQYDFLGDAIATKVDEIMNKMEPVINWVADHMDMLLTGVKAIGAALLLWKISNVFTSGLTDAFTTLNNIQGVLGATLTAGITIGLSYHFTNEYFNSGKVYNLVADALTTAFGSVITGNMVAKMTGKSALGKAASGAVMAISAALDLALVAGDVVDNGISKETWLASAWAAIEGTAAGGLIALAAGSSATFGAVVGGIVTLVAGVEVVLVAGMFNKEKVRQEEMWGDVEYTASEIQAIVQTLLGDIDVSAMIELANASITNINDAKRDLNAQVESLEMVLAKIKLGVTVDESDYATLESSAIGIVDELQRGLNLREKHVELTFALVPGYTGEEGGFDASAYISALTESDSIIMDTARSLGETISTWINDGIVEGLYNGQMYTVAELANYLVSIATAGEEARIRTQFAVDIEHTLTQASGKSFTEIVDGYIETIQAAENAFWGAANTAITEMETGIAQMEVVRDFYLATEGDQGENYLRAQEALDRLKAQRSEFDPAAYVAAGMADLLENENGVLVDAIRVFFEAHLQEGFSQINSDAMSRIFGEGMSSLIEAGIIEGDNILGKTPDDLVAFVNGMIQQAIGEGNYTVAMNVADVFDMTGWDLLTADLQTQLFTEMLGYFTTTTGLMTADEFVTLFKQTGLDMSALIAAGILEGGEEIGGSFETVSGEAAGSVADTVGQEFYEVGGVAIDRYSNAIADGGTEAVATANRVSQEVADALSGITGTGSKSNTQSGLTGLASGIEASVTKPIVQKFGEIQTSAETTFSNVKTSLQTQFSTMSSWFGTHVSRPMVNSVKNAGWYDAGRAAAQGIKKGIDSVELPKFELNWDTVTKKVGETTINLPILDLKFYAKGGMPTTGEMFVARESGPEMVGRIGNRSAVANNDQIVTGIEEGVYRAVTAAMSDSDNNVNVNVYLDGKEVYHNQQQVARAAGYQFAR